MFMIRTKSFAFMIMIMESNHVKRLDKIFDCLSSGIKWNQITF